MKCDTKNDPIFINGSFEENEFAIFEERSKEFIAEGNRWYDLRRMHDSKNLPFVLELMGVLENVEGQKDKILWPIDLATLAADPTLNGHQNPGYAGS